VVWVLTEQSVKSHSISSSVKLCHGKAKRSTRLVIRPWISYSHPPITPETRLHSQSNWCGISGDEVAAGLVSILFRFSPLIVIIIQRREDMHTDRCGNTRRQKCCAKGSGKEIKIQEFVYRDTTNVEPEMSD